jgi:hypothetical protein
MHFNAAESLIDSASVFSPHQVPRKTWKNAGIFDTAQALN